MEELIEAIKESLLGITNPRFYETERGFQGELYAELRGRLHGLEFELEGAIVEQEYQKRMPHHGFKIRPDLIIHVPFEGAGLERRSEGNFVVIELKRRASRNEARGDYKNLHQMCEKLGYPLAIFINIDSDETYIDESIHLNEGSIYAFAVRLRDGEVKVTEEARA